MNTVEQALVLLRENASPYQKAKFYLRLGNLSAAWPAYCKEKQQQYEKQTSIPESYCWRGQSLTGKKLLIILQGIKDDALFLRCIPQLKELAEEITFLGDKKLKLLYQALFPDVSFIEKEAKVTQVVLDYYLFLPTLGTKLLQLNSLTSLPPSTVRAPKEINEAGVKKTLLLDCKNYFPDAEYRQLLKSLAASFTIVECDNESAFNPAVFLKADYVLAVDDLVLRLAACFGVQGVALLDNNPDWCWLAEGQSSPWFAELSIVRKQQKISMTTLIEKLAAKKCQTHTLTISAVLQEKYRQMFAEQNLTAKEQINAYSDILQLDARQAIAWNNRGLLLQQLGHIELAFKDFQQAVLCDPYFVSAKVNLAFLLYKQKNYQSIPNLCLAVIKQDPFDAEVISLLARTHEQLRNYKEAKQAYDLAIAINPKCASAYTGRAIWLMIMRNYQASQKDFDKSLSLNANNPHAVDWLSNLQLRQGQYQAGWRNYEARFASMAVTQQVTGIPWAAWQADDFKDKKVLVYCEQGAGDNIQFFRLLRSLKQRCKAVYLAGGLSLEPLFQSAAVVDCFVNRCDEIPEHDYSIHLLSLAQYLIVKEDDIPANVPYLFADQKKRHAVQAQFSSSGLRIGIAWQGNSRFARNDERSLPVEFFLRLQQETGVRFYSLQIGGDFEQVIADNFIDLAPVVEGFSDTAACLAELDLLISTDTATVHLAGALGKPVWTLLAYFADWRWLLERDDSPWYPSMRLFKQKQLNNWDSIYNDVKQALLSFIAANG